MSNYVYRKYNVFSCDDIIASVALLFILPEWFIRTLGKGTSCFTLTPVFYANFPQKTLQPAFFHQICGKVYA